MLGGRGSRATRAMGVCALAFAAVVSASGCVHRHHHPSALHAHAGPPPHVPAHGYRHQHRQDGIELVFDARLGVYAVAGRPDLYWYGERYLRWTSGGWRAGAHLDGVWIVIASDTVPPKLVAKYAQRRAKGKRKGHGHGVPARHAD